MKLILHTFKGLFILFLLLSCADHEVSTQDATDGDVYLTLSLSIPGGQLPQTRGLSVDGEGTVHSLRALVFSENGSATGDKATFAYSASVTKLSAGSVTVLLRKSTAGEKYSLMLLANAPKPTREPTITDTREAVYQLFTFHYSQEWLKNGIPMSGVSASAQVIDENTSFGSISLKRSMARVDVGLDFTSLDNGVESANGLTNFALSSVWVYNANDGGYVADAGTMASATAFNVEYTDVSDKKLLTREIYLAEVKNTTDDTGATALPSDNRCCLILAGRYDANNNGSTDDDALCYYRVDFVSDDVTGKQMDIVRNNRYVVNVKKVTGPGFATVGEAFSSGPMNITVSINAWNKNDLSDVVFDGQHYFQCSTKTLVIPAGQAQAQVVDVASDVPVAEWKLLNQADWDTTLKVDLTQTKITFTTLTQAELADTEVRLQVKNLIIAFTVTQKTYLSSGQVTIPDWTKQPGQTVLTTADNASASPSLPGENSWLTGDVIEAGAMGVHLGGTADTHANCYVLTQGGAYTLDATVKGNGKVVPLPATYVYPFRAAPVPEDNITTIAASDIASAEVLWETVNTTTAPAKGTIVSNVSVSNGVVSFIASNVEGNAVIAVKNSAGKILWSWHIWRTNEAPVALPLKEIKTTDGTVLAAEGELKIMDRNLGALSNVPYAINATKGNLAAGLCYQWGRKDPMPGIADISINTTKGTVMATTVAHDSKISQCTVQESVEQPTTYFGNSQTWCSSANGNLWGGVLTTFKEIGPYYEINANPGVKTIYDPCPAGWHVMPNYTFANSHSTHISASWIGNGVNIVEYTTLSSGIYFVPAAGSRYYNGTWYSISYQADLWTASSTRTDAYTANRTYLGTNHNATSGDTYSAALSVRCVNE